MTRWTRYGHDRSYVETPDGARLGYRDNRTGLVVLTDEAHRAAVEQAVARPVPAAGRAVVPAESVVPPPDREPAPPDVVARVCTDLADNRPGQAARRQAVALRRSAPVRTFVERLLGLHTEERSWRVGADGEEAVAARLRRLDADWRVLHAVPVGTRGSDIDHVVIGPAGVFTVNTKHHPRSRVWVGGDTVLVGGTRQPYVRNSRHEARRASRLLTAACGFPVAAVGLVAVVGARDLTVRSQPAGGDVHLLSGRTIDRWLRSRPVGVLTAAQVGAVHERARRSTTWGG